MVEWLPESYWLVRFLFQRSLAVIYLLAFLVAATQFRPLAGESGLLPISQYVERSSFRERPSLFYYYPSDRVIGIAAWSGVALSAVALAAGPYWLPAPYAVPASMALWLVLWGLYLSFVNAGQTFYGYGWESMLLETGFLAVFLGAGPSGPPVAVVWLIKWVLFRNMFGAGLIKMRGDDVWRNLTAMDYHYETQPIPNPLSWYVHHLPDRFHRVEVLGNHVVELAVPFLYFAPQPWASVAGAATIGFQGWLMLTGNFSWLNALTIVQAIAAFSDGVLASLAPVSAPTAADPPLYLQVLAIVLAVVVLARSVRPVGNMLSETQVMNTSFDPLSLVNTYGAFGSITRDRYELVVQGTTDETITEDTEWRTYEFEGKPTDPTQRPRQVAPYHHRLDWQLWFAAMRRSPRRSPWFPAFLERLLSADEATLSLLAEDPFSGTTPEHVRAVRYRYRFTTPEERRETGEWWSRERVGAYVNPVSADDLRLRWGR
ncbi:lipase maturation factor family protein [Halomicroarcula limicola]|uniref:Lipase maturation factor family protein n=1 Tax=Haloarcula limicola TaxID=1429915 RepID=A0A8J7Y9C4_9EURY|nr:lipase maturation factor family protein [Halomicroarcula limicola]MBV0924466.1 lipase maturation factor family protein [Halomicroarcula limicola]